MTLYIDQIKTMSKVILSARYISLVGDVDDEALVDDVDDEAQAVRSDRPTTSSK